MNIRRLFALSIILFTSGVFAEVAGVKSNIKSDIVKIVKDKNFIEFKNNVILVREDISFLAKKMLRHTAHTTSLLRQPANTFGLLRQPRASDLLKYRRISISFKIPLNLKGF